MSEYLLKHLEEASSLLTEGRLSLFLDYDGTLTRITGRPEDACMSYQVRELMRALAARYPLAIISGRSLADIRSKVGMEGIVYAGNHGLEVHSPLFTMTYDIGRQAREELEGLRAAFRALAEKFKGVIFEDKGFTLTVHYRLLSSRSFEIFKESFDAAVSGALGRGHVRLGQSKKAFEIKATVRWDKGRAVNWLLDRPLFRGTTPVYIGDDETDRDSYRAIGTKGLSVNVGGAVDEAPYFLQAQEEVVTFLKWLLGQPSSACGLISII